MEEGRVLAAGEAIEGLFYEDAMRWCQRGWQAWRPNWPPGWFLSVKADCVLYLTTKVLSDIRSTVADIGTEDRAAKDWIVKSRRHLDVVSPSDIPQQPEPAFFSAPWNHKDPEIRLQIAVREIVNRATEEGLSASGAFRVLDHELARVGEIVESASAG